MSQRGGGRGGGGRGDDRGRGGGGGRGDGGRGGMGRGGDGGRGGSGGFRGGDGQRGGGGGFRGGDGQRGGGGGFRGGDGQRGGGGGFRGGDGQRGGGGGFRGGDGQRGGGGGYQGGGGDRGRGGGSFGGGDRGSRGGYGPPRGGPRGRGAPPEFVNTPLPAYDVKFFPNMDKVLKTGWKEYSFKTKEDVKLQPYKGLPATEHERKITISVNHFALRSFRLPEKIYHYEVTMERVRESRDPEKKGGSQKPDETKGKKGQKGKKLPPQGGKDPSPDQPAGGAAVPLRRLPKPLPQLVLSVLMERIRREMKFHGIVSDLSNNVYSTKKLEGNINLTNIVNLEDVDQTILQETDTGNIRVTIEPTALRIDTRAMSEYLNNNNSWKGMDMDVANKSSIEQVYNAIVKSMPNFRFLPQGRSNLIRWPLESQGDQLGSGVVNWKGVSANIAMGWLPYLNIDMANCAFLEDRTVVAALTEHFGGPPGNVQDWRREDFESAKAFLRNVKVFYSLPGGKKFAGPVTDVLATSPKNTFFECQNRKTSVLDYFLLTYKVTLKNPDGPCLLLRGKSQVPAELCTIKKGQSFNRKLGDNQTREMLTLAKKEPSRLEGEIKTAVESMRLHDNPILQAWGVDISKDLLKLDETRVLAAPKLRYGAGTERNQGKGNAEITPVNGEWEIWNSDYEFFQSKDVKRWGILVAGSMRSMRTDQNQIELFAQQLISNGRQKGVNFLNPRYDFAEAVNVRDDSYSATTNVDTLKKMFRQNFQQPGNECTLVLVVIPKKNSPVYSHVKQAAELHAGILTQCVVAQNVFKGQAATVQNILLKINSKLGGINHVIITPPTKQHLKVIDIHKIPMLIMGADVTHPPPGTMKRIKGVEVPVPSYAAVTGSIDKSGMPFMMDIRAQTKAGRGAAEVIQNLDAIVLKMLQKFKEMTDGPLTPSGVRPRKIIYYRDGVGEGQFNDVLHTEMGAMRRACEKLTDYDGGKYEPSITFITVQKRHKTRFFYHPRPGETVQAPPGTVVDTQIVHQTEADFYLLSHKGMMGTSRPTRYHVLWDDSNFSADQIQTLTYYLCYMYVRCNKSVRLPAPTYYAHWAAARAKALTDGLDEQFDNLPRLNDMMKRHEGFAAAFPMHFV